MKNGASPIARRKRRVSAFLVLLPGMVAGPSRLFGSAGRYRPQCAVPELHRLG